MLLRYSPLLQLSVLQLVALSVAISAYITSNWQAHAPAQQSTDRESTPASGDSLASHDRPLSVDMQPNVMIKPVPYYQVRDNFRRPSTPLKFRAFSDSNVENHHNNHVFSRTLRSVRHSKRDQSHATNGWNATDENTHTVNVKDNNSEELSPDATSSGLTHLNIDDPSVEYEDDKHTHDDDDDDIVTHSLEENQEVLEEALYHMEASSKCPRFHCRHPTPFVHMVRNPYSGARNLYPECIVLHRCMNFSGCCPDVNHECAPKSMNIISKAFLVINRMSSHENPTVAMTLSFVNHTECECREKPKPPKCTKSCYGPFRLSQEGSDCYCDCLPVGDHHPWACESIKGGVLPLPPEDLKCIQNGSCYKPRCSLGEFNLTSGFCLLSDEYALPAFMFENPEDRHRYREHIKDYNFSDSVGKIVPSQQDLPPTTASSGYIVDQNKTIEENHGENVFSQDKNVHPTEEMDFNGTQNSSNTQTYAYSAQNFSDISNMSSQQNESMNHVSIYQPSGTNPGLLSAKTMLKRSDEYDEYPDIDDDEKFNDYYSDAEVSSLDVSEGQDVLDSPSQGEMNHTATAPVTRSQDFMTSATLPAKVWGTKNTNSNEDFSQNVLRNTNDFTEKNDNNDNDSDNSDNDGNDSHNNDIDDDDDNAYDDDDYGLSKKDSSKEDVLKRDKSLKDIPQTVLVPRNDDDDDVDDEDKEEEDDNNGLSKKPLSKEDLFKKDKSLKDVVRETTQISMDNNDDGEDEDDDDLSNEDLLKRDESLKNIARQTALNRNFKEKSPTDSQFQEDVQSNEKLEIQHHSLTSSTNPSTASLYSSESSSQVPQEHLSLKTS